MSDLRKFDVVIPIAGRFEFEIEAESAEEASALAMTRVRGDYLKAGPTLLDVKATGDSVATEVKR